MAKSKDFLFWGKHASAGSCIPAGVQLCFIVNKSREGCRVSALWKPFEMASGTCCSVGMEFWEHKWEKQVRREWRRRGGKNRL